MEDGLFNVTHSGACLKATSQMVFQPFCASAIEQHRQHADALIEFFGIDRHSSARVDISLQVVRKPVSYNLKFVLPTCLHQVIPKFCKCLPELRVSANDLLRLEVA